MQGVALHQPQSVGATIMIKTKLAIVAVGVAVLGAAGAADRVRQHDRVSAAPGGVGGAVLD